MLIKCESVRVDAVRRVGQEWQAYADQLLNRSEDHDGSLTNIADKSDLVTQFWVVAKDLFELLINVVHDVYRMCAEVWVLKVGRILGIDLGSKKRVIFPLLVKNIHLVCGVSRAEQLAGVLGLRHNYAPSEIP